jgi:hypothetical protein
VKKIGALGVQMPVTRDMREKGPEQYEYRDWMKNKLKAEEKRFGAAMVTADGTTWIRMRGKDEIWQYVVAGCGFRPANGVYVPRMLPGYDGPMPYQKQNDMHHLTQQQHMYENAAQLKLAIPQNKNPPHEHRFARQHHSPQPNAHIYENTPAQQRQEALPPYNSNHNIHRNNNNSHHQNENIPGNHSSRNQPQPQAPVSSSYNQKRYTPPSSNNPLISPQINPPAPLHQQNRYTPSSNNNPLVSTNQLNSRPPAHPQSHPHPHPQNHITASNSSLLAITSLSLSPAISATSETGLGPSPPDRGIEKHVVPDLQAPKLDFEAMRKDLLARGELFEDTEFPAVDSSLYFSCYPPYKITWMRAKVRKNKRI